MKQAKWLVQAVQLGDKPLVAALERNGYKYKTLDNMRNVLKSRYKYQNLFKPDDCVVCRTSIEFGQVLRHNVKWIPGIYAHMDDFRCSTYYPKFGNRLFNQNYMMFPYGELERRMDFIFSTLGEDRCIFIRPDKGNKVFTGRVLEQEKFLNDLKILGFYYIEPNELCVVASPRNVGMEVRFVVVDCEVITGSIYRDSENHLIENPEPCDLYLLSLAQSVIDNTFKGSFTDRVWTIDLCTTIHNPQQWYVLEVNSFSYSGLYGCDFDKVVQEVSRVALEEYNEYQQA